MSPTVVAVDPGSAAARAGLLPGDEIVSIAGQAPRDVIEYRLLTDEPDLELEVRRGNLEIALAVEKEAGEPLGAEVHSAVFDRVQTCDNHCEFCFIYQLPPGMRRSLYLKDDDYRLSFLYGNFTTLTRFTEADLERVLGERLSPLFVSIHATDPEVRARMLRNRRGATSLRWLRALLDGGIEVHGQVVVCPGVNDGAILEDTLCGVLDRFPDLASVAAVPLGVSRFSSEASMRPHTVPEARAVVETVDRWQEVFSTALGRRIVFAADEYYLLAGRPFPDAAAYDGFPQQENGVGMAAALASEIAGTGGPAATRHGFFASVDGAPADGYRAPRGPVVAAAAADGPVAVLTGAYGAAVLVPLLASLGRHDVRVVAVPNEYFGGNIAVTGLMVGADVGRVLAGQPYGHRYLLPDVCLSRGLFLDGARPEDLPRPVEVVPTTGEALLSAIGERAACERADPLPAPAAEALPVVAVVGRPNVGKSTLVNRVIGRREAIVEQRPGVTRDRKVVEAEWAGTRFTLVDTGGWLAGGDSLDAKVSAQAEKAMAGADLIVFVVDATVGVTAEDEAVAAVLRRGRVPVLVAANKVDSEHREPDVWDFVALGLGEPVGVSALHGRSSGDLLDEIVGRLPDRPISDGSEVGAQPEADDGRVPLVDERVPGVAIVGRPNVGKSTLFNRLTGDERSIVHDLPGTTRDTVDTIVETGEGPLRFVDTAGMRRKSRVGDGPEYFSMVRALQAIDSADAALLVIDATEGVTHQDQRLAERVDAAGSPVVVVLNKWEMVSAEERDGVLVDVGDRLAFLAYAPVLKVSAKTGLGAHKLLPALHEAIAAYHRRVPTRELNQLIQSAQAAHASAGGRVLYATQGAVDPPTFTLFTTKPLAPTYLRYLERRIREHFGFGPTPLKLRVRRRST